MYILLDEKFMNRVEGLCGDYNGEADDDLTKGMATNPQEFGNSFAIGSCPMIEPKDVVQPCEVSDIY